MSTLPREDSCSPNIGHWKDAGQALYGWKEATGHLAGVRAGLVTTLSWVAPEAGETINVSSRERTRTCVSGQLTAHTDIPLASFQVVNGADVIQASAGHVVARRGVRTGHDPRGTQRDGVDLDDRTETQTCSCSKSSY